MTCLESYHFVAEVNFKNLLQRYRDTFPTNEFVNSYNTRCGKFHYIPKVNTTHNGIKSLRYNGPVIQNDSF